MDLFDKYPILQDDVLTIRRMSFSDEKALKDLTEEKDVYRYLPTFLYEQKYEDKYQVIKRMDEECMDSRESVLMGIYLKEDPKTLIGIAEIYGYRQEKNKASIGYRLRKQYWGRGLATRTAALLKDYLFTEIGIRTITAHVMKENLASAKVLIKNGFFNKYPDNIEDWGFDEPVLVDKYSIRNRFYEERK